MNYSAETSKKILSPKALIEQLKKKKGQRVVFTNGCFDLLHAGHLKLLEKAKSLGELLVVGLNSDSSVKKLKGKGRPILSDEERAKILAALSWVDYVVIFKEATPEKLIRQLKPDILVKGADYNKNEIVGRDVAKKVVRVPLLKNLSTSRIIEKILKAYGN